VTLVQELLRREFLLGLVTQERFTRADRDAFDRWSIVRRGPGHIGNPDLSTTVLGINWPAPLFLSPIAYHTLAHPEGELATARAAAGTGLPFILSMFSSVEMEQVARVMGDSPRWLQLYLPVDMNLLSSFVRRAETTGYSALVVTIDMPMMRPERHQIPHLIGHGIGNFLADPVFRSALREPPEQNLSGAGLEAVRMVLGGPIKWDRVWKLRQITRLPILLKGILQPDDAVRAMRLGVNGIIVSSHGGLAGNGRTGALSALPAIREATSGRIPVLIDSGVRSGADVLKAIALGASAVGIGRPYIFGLAADGERGVRKTLDGLIVDLARQLILSGYRSVKEVDRSAVVPRTT
jgi:lactate 2-monooxygenase